MAYIKTVHNKKVFDRMCSALEDSKNLTCRYEAQSGGKIDFIYKNKATHEEKTLRYEKR
jgi:hypothetical protein